MHLRSCFLEHRAFLFRWLDELRFPNGVPMRRKKELFIYQSFLRNGWLISKGTELFVRIKYKNNSYPSTVGSLQLEPKITSLL